MRRCEYQMETLIYHDVLAYAMQAKIITEKILFREDRARKVIGFEGIKAESKLPVEYLAAVEPARIDRGMTMEYAKHLHFGMDNGRLHLMPPEDMHGLSNDGCGCRSYYITRGDVFAEDDFQKIVCVMRKAGARYARIKHELKLKTADWCGKEVIEI